jgi:hypothetical protein
MYSGYKEPHTEIPGLNYGTCRASKTVGALCGIAKKANMVVVKLEEQTASHLLRALASTAVDIELYGLQGKSVINISSGFNPNPTGITGKLFILYKSAMCCVSI